MSADDEHLGLFKGSGLIVSTGTGSTGWLYAVRKIREDHLRMVQKLLGSIYQDYESSRLTKPLAK